MRIVIIGAGVGGLASAVGLTAAGHQVEVYEGAGRLRVGGNGMIVWSNGTGVLQELGVSLDGLGHPMHTTEQFSDGGELLLQADWSEMVSHYRAPIMLTRRGRLVERLAEALPAGTVRFGQECTGVRNNGSGAVASFAGGGDAVADVIIGADGHKSVVRRCLVGDAAAEYTGWAAWHGVSTLDVELTRSAKVQAFLGKDGAVALHPLGDGQLFWAFETRWREGETAPPAMSNGNGNGTHTSIVDRLRERFGKWPAPIPQLLDTVGESDVSLFPHVLHRVPKPWGQGRITLVGDAAHVVPPRTAQGVNQALEDAWMLSRLLAEPADPPAALREYERIRRPKVRALYMGSRIANTAIGERLLQLLIRKGRQASPKAQKRNARMFSNYLSELSQGRTG